MKYRWFIQSPAKYFFKCACAFPRTALSGHRLNFSFRLCKLHMCCNFTLLHISTSLIVTVQFSVLCCDNTAEGVLDSTKKISWHLLRLLGFCWLKNWKWNVASRPQRFLFPMRNSAHNHVNWTWYDRCCESVNRTCANLQYPGFGDTYTANILFWRLPQVFLR